MSKRIEEMTASEAMESICNSIDFLTWLLDAGDEDDCEDMLECAEAHGMVGLPRDAEGEPIHIGDLVALGDDQAFYVEEMRLAAGKDGDCFWSVSGADGVGKLIEPSGLRHIAEDTLEGILMEAVMRAHCDTLADKDGTDVTDLLERLRDLMGKSDER